MLLPLKLVNKQTWSHEEKKNANNFLGIKITHLLYIWVQIEYFHNITKYYSAYTFVTQIPT